MAYKDEYEVARLHLKQAWHTRLTGMFAQPQKIYYHFHPPAPQYGPAAEAATWPVVHAAPALAAPSQDAAWPPLGSFGYAKVRRVERQLIPWYRQTITQVLAHLDDSNHALAVVIANAPDAIRGYEDIKLRRLAETQELVAQHLARFTTSTPRGSLLRRAECGKAGTQAAPSPVGEGVPIIGVVSKQDKCIAHEKHKGSNCAPTSPLCCVHAGRVCSSE